MKKPIIAITMGDPAGIGPEVIIKGFSHQMEDSPQQLLVIGDSAVLQNCADQLKLPHPEIVVIAAPSDFVEGKLNVIETTPAVNIEPAVVSKVESEQLRKQSVAMIQQQLNAQIKQQMTLGLTQ